MTRATLGPRPRFCGHREHNLLSGLLLHWFRYRDPPTGKWVRARYNAERREIAGRCAEWETLGLPEIRSVDDWGAAFKPPSLVIATVQADDG